MRNSRFAMPRHFSLEADIVLIETMREPHYAKGRSRAQIFEEAYLFAVARTMRLIEKPV